MSSASLAVGIQGTLTGVACHSVAVVASGSFVVLGRIVGRVVGSLASLIVGVVVRQDQLVLKLELEIQPVFKLGYELEPCCSFVREYQKLASTVLLMRKTMMDLIAASA